MAGGFFVKKVSIFLIALFCIFSLTFFQNSALHEIFLLEANTFYIYSNVKNDSLSSVEKIKNGKGEIIKFNKVELLNNYSKLSAIAGESIVVSGLTLNEIVNKLNLKIINIDKMDNYFIVNGYSNRLNNYLMVDGNRQNIQLKYSLNSAVIGCPLIMQGF